MSVDKNILYNLSKNGIMNELMKLPSNVLDALNEEEMLFVKGGATMVVINNGSGSCSSVNHGQSCDATNSGTSCNVINNGSGSCSATNNSGHVCDHKDTNPHA